MAWTTAARRGGGVVLKTREAKVGKAIVRLAETKSGYAGIVLLGNDIKTKLTGQSAEGLWQQLLVEAEKSNPNFVGFDGAKNRFQRIFKDGFKSPVYRLEERDYKVKAKSRLDTVAPLDTALDGKGLGPVILAVYQSTNLLNAQFEKPRIREALLGPHADLFVRGAAIFAMGDIDRGLSQMEQALKPHDVAKWTAVTYLPFLWRPDIHMFLKPQVTRNFAERVGHALARDYSAKLKCSVYRSLLDLVATTEKAIGDLEPADHIDVQSFIWVVGEYTADDEAGLN
jgi:hypothetical protein